MQLIEHNRRRWRMRQFVESCAEDQQPVHQQRDADEKPDGDRSAISHFWLFPTATIAFSPEQNIYNQEAHRYHTGPKDRTAIIKDILFGPNIGRSIHQTPEFSLRL